MTDAAVAIPSVAPATSDLLNSSAAPPPATAPKWQPTGFPIAPAAFDAPEAVAARAEIKEKAGDKDFYKSLIAERERGVTGPASQAWAELHKRGWPSAPAVLSQADVDSQAVSRNAELWNAHIADLKTRFPLTEQQEAEIRSGVVDEKSHQWAHEEKDRLIKDAVTEGAAAAEAMRSRLAAACPT
jgi:hypothetical protein